METIPAERHPVTSVVVFWTMLVMLAVVCIGIFRVGSAMLQFLG